MNTSDSLRNEFSVFCKSGSESQDRSWRRHGACRARLLNLKTILSLVLLLSTGSAWAARYAKVTTAVTPAGSGYAYISTSQTIGTNTEATQSSNSNNSNKTFYIKAVAASGYVFDHWEFVNASGTTSIASSTSAETSITVQTAGSNNNTRENTIRAVFVKTYDAQVTTTVSPAGSGTAYISATSTIGTATEVSGGTKEMESEITFYVKATPAEGYVFSSWSFDRAPKSAEIEDILSATTTITVTTSDNTSSPEDYILSASFEIMPDPISIDAENLSLNINETAQISYSVIPYNAFTNFSYTSNNTSIATVNADGVVTGVAQGTATITIQALDRSNQPIAGVSTTCTVTVSNLVLESAGYVIMSDESHFLGGTSTTNNATFKPSTCIWTKDNSNYWSNPAGGYLRNNSTIITTNTSYRGQFTLSGTESGTTGQTLNNGSYYITYTTSWTRSNNGSGDQNVVFSAKRIAYPASDETAPTISGDDEIPSLGNTSFTKTNASYVSGYLDYIFYNGAHHYCLTESSNATTTQPTTEDLTANFTYTWSLEGIDAQYAEINSSTGVISYKKFVKTNTTATIKLTATSSSPSKTFTVTKTVTFKHCTINPTSISITSENPLTVYTGLPEVITYTLMPDPCYDNVVFSSGNTSVATVDADGVVSGVAEGTATITVQTKKTDGTNGPSATVTVNVIQADNVGYVIMSDESHFLGGTSTTNNATFKPSTCIWTKDNSSNYWSNPAGGYLRNNNTIITTNTYYRSAFTLAGTESGTTGQTLNNGNYYITYTTSWTRSNNGSGDQNVVFKAFRVTTDPTETAPAISGDSQIAVLGANSSFSVTTPAFYMAGYYDYIFYNKAHHYCLTTSSNATTTQPTTEDLAANFTYTWSLEGIDAQYAEINSSTGVITYKKMLMDNDVVATVKMVASSTAKTFTAVSQQVTFKSVTVDPTAISGTPVTVYVGSEDTVNYTLTSSGTGLIYEYVEATTSNAGKFTVASSNPHRAGIIRVTGVSVGTANLNIAAKKKPGTDNITSCSSTVQITIRDVVSKPVFDFMPSLDGETATTTILSATAGAAIYYTTDGTTPTTSSTLFSEPFTVNEGDEIRAFAMMPSTQLNYQYYDDSEIEVVQYQKCYTAEPSIIINNGSVTFTSYDEDVIFYYTSDGSDPTITSASWTTTMPALTGFTNESTIKVVARTGYCIPSEVVSSIYYAGSGVSGGVVTLNDLEDHTWTYYAGVPSDVDANYNTTYSGTLYSPDPRNVKITYYANDGAVSIDESDTTFVYYKTIEKVNNAYTYQVISNPFSKRPTNKGFAGWKIISGGDYISGKNNNDVLALDEEITFENLSYTSVNCISADIELQATWTDANIQYITANPGSNQTYSFTGGTYETNFIVLKNVDYTRTMTISSPATIMMVEPDGSADYRSNTFSGNIKPDNNGVTKIEFANWHYNGTVYTYHKSMTIGRGLNTSSNFATGVYGNPNTSGTVSGNLVYTIKIESGKTSYFNLTNDTESSNNQIVYSGTLSAKCILGCDYDRASGNNSNMSLTASGTNGTIYGGQGLRFSNSENQNNLTFDWTIKSGTVMSGILNDAEGGTQSLYMGSSIYNSDGISLQYFGRRRMTIEGGDLASIAGGVDDIDRSRYLVDDGGWTVMIRMKGGNVRGSIYGAAAQAGSAGDRLFVFTGGTVGGWVAGGANGTASDGGVLDGTSRLYIGGNTSINSNGSQSVINRAVGGNVFGAGCGYSTSSSSGQVSNGTNVVIADNAYIERGVYGGGSYGYCSTNQNANIYIIGGHVGGENGGVSGTSYSGSIIGGVFGGACQNKGGSSKIYMYDGIVNSGVYGGSNSSGTLSGSVEMHINGGKVGTASMAANVHGGGFGQQTQVNGNVDVTIGTKTGNDISYTTSGDAVIYGDVYGGSALGKVNGTSVNYTYGTNVTLNAGTIYGSLYGGGLGNSSTPANVYGSVTVKVYGGSVKKTSADGSGGIYGCNNINGAPQGNVFVNIYGTDPAPAEGQYALYSVYGGGNKADYNDSPDVTIHNCDNSIEYIYGGGNAAAVLGTNVTIYGGNKIGNVFGGGNGTVSAANVGDAGTLVMIYGGTIGNVFGGSNSQGTIEGGIEVMVSPEAEDTYCPINIDNLYGGGNKAASNAGILTIGCGSTIDYHFHIGNVYGGANQADITGDIDLYINSGTIDNVFGGNNTSGSISGTITVTVDEESDPSCGMEVGNVYGGGNKAAYTGNPMVNINNGHITGSVFGGGLGTTAIVTGNPQVTVGTNTGTVHIDGNVFGGGDAANVAGSPVVVVNNCNTLIGTKTDGEWNTTGGSVYGGGNAAHVTGSSNSTSVTINGGDMYRVFGGGNGEVSPANVEGSVSTTIHGGNIHQAFAGSNKQGSIAGTATIDVKHTSTCEEYIDEVYGGGNEASGNAGVLSVACGAVIGDVYGGANKANVTSDITLNITGGTINRVFGGNNTSGSISGSITVNVNKADDCDTFSVQNVYGAGNQAAYTPDSQSASPAVNIIKGTVIQNVFGGGLGATAIVTSNPKVTISGGAIGGSVYGGGSAADVEGDTNVQISSGNVDGNVYGGGKAANVSGNAVVNIGQ